MPLPLPPEVLSALSYAIHALEEDMVITIVGGGLINHSFKATDKNSGKSYLLQKINTSVFREPEKLQQNYAVLFRFALSHETIKVPAPVFFQNGTTLFRDKNNDPWRSTEWIDNSRTIDAVNSIADAKEVAETFAGFTLACKDLDASDLQQTIPHFHDLSLRHEQFLSAWVTGSPERKVQSNALVFELKKRSHYHEFFDRIKNSPSLFRLRVMHHDAKISNILFDTISGKAWGPVDLDTVMPGYYFSDLGDMIRSLAGNRDENDNDISAMHLREDYYETLTEHYSAIMKDEWTGSEMKHLHACGLLMIYMQALRFITDHLQGDTYYQVSYQGQNYDRAINQFALLQLLEGYLLKKYGYSL